MNLSWVQPLLFVISGIVAFVLGLRFHRCVALWTVRVVRGPWWAIGCFLLWGVVGFFSALGLAGTVIPWMRGISPVLAWAVILPIVTALLALSIPFAPVTGGPTGSNSARGGFERVGIYGAYYRTLKIVGFLFMCFNIVLIIMLGDALIRPGA